MRAKKTYCTLNPPVAVYSEGNVSIYLHGIQHGIEDYAMMSSIETRSMKNPLINYHRRKIGYNSIGQPYVKMPLRRMYLHEFIRKDSQWL